jgi:teichuronic acid biosynthesis glycosyltransferase TuaC
VTQALQPAIEPEWRQGPGVPVEADAGRLRIVSLCCCYPNPVDGGQGVFIQRRLRAVAAIADVTVVAPFALARYSSPKGNRLRWNEKRCPADRLDGSLTVLHPRWLYPPAAGALIPLFLFAQLFPRLFRMSKRTPFDAIDAHFGFPDGIAAALLSACLDVPFTITLRGSETVHARSPIVRWFMGWALRRAARVFTVSVRLAQFAIDLGAAPGKVKTIPNGVDAGVFYPRDRAVCRAKHGIAPDCRLIVSAGALVRGKGHDRAIRAVHAVATAGIAVQLAIVGGEAYERQTAEELRRCAAELGLGQVVRFFGPVDAETMAEIMSAADVLCLASEREGWPNVVHEAMACGLPVVATDVGAVTEMMAGANAGIVVPPGDQAALDAALLEALRRTWDRPAISAHGRARTWQHVASEVVEEMRLVCGARSC